MRKRMARILAALIFSLASLAAPWAVQAQQQGGTTSYVYDDNGRLQAVISPTGEAVIYEYDLAGNITAVRRLAADALAILSFSPHEGMPGDQVTFTGMGFGGGVSAVSFNGASATVISFTASTVVAEVPQAATTGPVTIITPHGSVTTQTPFTIAGVRLTPTSVLLNFGESQQFNAQVLPSSLDQTLKWSVNGIDGGNETIGLVSSTGLYTAPSREGVATIRATSAADTSRYAEARVRVRNPADLQAALAPSVSILYGTNTGGTAAVTSPLAVQYGNSAVASAALSGRISVMRGTASTQTSALADSPVSVRYGSASEQSSAASTVSATKGPYIQAVSPGQAARGSTVTLTLSGVGLGGATALRFIDANGNIDASLTVSNITVSSDGNSLTATLNISANATLGSRTVVVSTPTGDSQTFALTANTIQVFSP